MYATDITFYLKMLYTAVIFYNFSQSCVKGSILFQCYRIFRIPRAQRLFTILLIITAFYAAFDIFGAIFTCYPIELYWDPTVNGHCMDRATFYYAVSAIDLVHDIITLCAPIPFLHRLNIATRVKFMLIGVFTCGFLFVLSFHFPSVLALSSSPSFVWTCGQA